MTLSYLMVSCLTKQTLHMKTKNKMKLSTIVVALCILTVTYSCGDAPIGFNIGKVVPLDFPVELEGINDSKLPIQGLANPPAYTLVETFELTDVTSEVNAVEEILINSLEYKIEGVDASEDFQMDEFTILVRRAGINGAVIAELTLFENGDPIANVSRQSITNFDGVELAAALRAEEEITTSAIVDFAEIPSPIEFEFTFYFDVVVKVRP